MAGELSKLADELEGLDDEPTGEVHVHMPKGTTLEADRTGKLKAISIPDDDEPAKAQHSDPPPKSGVTAIIVAVTGGVARINSWPAALVGLAVAAVAALWVWLTKR